MKPKILFTAAIAAFAIVFAGCNSGKKTGTLGVEKSTLSLSAEAQTVKFKITLAGAGSANIDWGDGNVQAMTLEATKHAVEHVYADTVSERRVKVSEAWITELNCDNNRLTALDVSNCPDLQYLECDGNRLAALDVSNNPELNYLSCHHNRLAALDVSKNPALRYLACYANSLASLDLSGNPEVRIIDCGGNQLTELNLAKNRRLERLYCPSNQLASIDVSRNRKLEDLLCFNNRITAVDLSKNSAMTNFDCGGNLITALDFSKNKRLQYVGCNDNKLSEEALDAIFASLHDKVFPEVEKLIVLTNNPGSADCIRLILIKKKWRAQ